MTADYFLGENTVYLMLWRRLKPPRGLLSGKKQRHKPKIATKSTYVREYHQKLTDGAREKTTTWIFQSFKHKVNHLIQIDRVDYLDELDHISALYNLDK